VSDLLSIIVPVYNEQENIEPLFERLGQVACRVRQDFGMMVEVIVNDNHSKDRTFEALRTYAERADPQVFELRIFRFARNVGFQKSILVGYCKARGDAVVQIDADLQDPPELILEFLSKWREGYKVVYGVRRRRHEGIMMQALRRLFYRLIDQISPDDLPYDSGDFRLIDRAMVDVICQLRDHDPYLRGFVATLGLKQIGIPYDRAARQRGTSKFGLAELLKLAIDGIINHSALPLRLASYVALLVVAVGVILILYYFSAWLFSPAQLPLGFITQTLLQLGSLAILSFLIAIQGLYINRIYNQVKDRPLAIIEYCVSKGAADDPISVKVGSKIEVIWSGKSSPAHKRTLTDAT
jgi:glycosyltransferase involved in cell wall biosynthesis